MLVSPSKPRFHTCSTTMVRVTVRPELRIRYSSTAYSRWVSAICLPARETLWRKRSSTRSSTQILSNSSVGRRKSAPTRARSSSKENGFTRKSSAPACRAVMRSLISLRALTKRMRATDPAQLSQHGQPIQLGQVPIQDHKIVINFRAELQTVFSIYGHIHREMVCLQTFDQGPCNFGLIFNDKNAHKSTPGGPHRYCSRKIFQLLVSVDRPDGEAARRGAYVT